MIKISVVIPVYNGEKYIAKCLDSILTQTLKEIEIIIIDDGGNDLSISICKEFQNRDSRIKIVSQKNSGTSMARKKGVMIANGKYLMFSDQDDYYCRKDALEIVYNRFEETKASVIQYSFYKKFRFLKIKVPSREKSINKAEFFRKYYGDLLTSVNNETLITPTVWNKAYVTEIVKERIQLINCSLRMTEDLYFNVHILSSPNIEKVVTITDALYCWRTGIGFSSRVDLLTLLHDYNILKTKQVKIIKERLLKEDFLYACNIESIYIMISYIKEKILNKNDEIEIKDNLKQFLNMEFIEDAIQYFEGLPAKSVWDDIKIVMSRNEEYIYNYFKEQKISWKIRLKKCIKKVVRKVI